MRHAKFIIGDSMVEKKKKGGWVYGVETTRKDGSKDIKIYEPYFRLF